MTFIVLNTGDFFFFFTDPEKKNERVTKASGHALYVTDILGENGPLHLKIYTRFTITHKSKVFNKSLELGVRSLMEFEICLECFFLTLPQVRYASDIYKII